MKRKAETAASLRGIRGQVRNSINQARDGQVLLTVKQAKRIEEALKQFERFKSILTGKDTSL